MKNLAEKNEDSSWNAEITLSDILYNLAFISQKLGVIKEYKVIAKLTIKIQKNGKIEKL